MGTEIAWTDETWNPIVGCSPAGTGCLNCYAARFASRGLAPAHRGLAVGGKWTGEVRFLPERLAVPLRWRKPRRVFVNSMSDLFHDGVTDEQIAAVFGVMAACPHLTFQVLTKRPMRARRWFEWIADQPTLLRTLPKAPRLICSLRAQDFTHDHWTVADPVAWPLPNVWLGVSASTQADVDRLVPDLLACPAAVRWVSLEPLLERVDLRRFLPCGCCAISAQTPALDWVVVGCESGPKRRPMPPFAHRDVRDQCRAASVPYFLKQAEVLGKVGSMPELDGERWAMFPEVTR